MSTAELADVLREIPGTEVTAGPGLLSIHVPAIGDTARLRYADLLDAEYVDVPTGAPAIQVNVRRGREVLPLIVTVDDLVFGPAYADELLHPDEEHFVPAMPGMVAYSEMHRDVRAFGRAVDDPDVAMEPEMVAATLLAHRCFLAGAIRVGLWPIRVAAWWEYASAQAGRDVGLPDFRFDPLWEQLMDDVAEARRQSEATLDA